MFHLPFARKKVTPTPRFATMTFQVNLFNQYAVAARYDKYADKNIRALIDTMKEFRVPQQEWAEVGSTILHFAHYMARNNRPFKLHKLVKTNRLSLGYHAMVQMYENYCERLNTVPADHE